MAAILSRGRWDNPVRDGARTRARADLCQNLINTFRNDALHDSMELQHHLMIMMTSSNGSIFRVTGPLCGNSPVTGELPAQRPVTRSFVVFFDRRLEFLYTFINYIGRYDMDGSLHPIENYACSYLSMLWSHAYHVSSRRNPWWPAMDLLPDTENCGLRMRRERFPRHWGVAIPTWITARGSRTRRDACRDR